MISRANAIAQSAALGPRPGAKPFFVELIKPSRYDDDGYVVQWWRSWIPSNTLACLYGLTLDAAATGAIGEGVQIVPHAYDETNTLIPVRKIIRRIRRGGGRGVVCLVGVQSNQFPRAVDIARPFRRAGIPVVIGGFHVSGCLAMLPEMPADLKETMEMGITLFAGEAEGRLEDLLADAYHGRLKPLYNFLGELPDLTGRPMPYLPPRVLSRCAGGVATFETGRGCPFNCKFCTIINVQGRKVRSRSPDDVEHLVRAYHDQGIDRIFITDDNFARNPNWEAILDRLIDLRERDGIKLKFLIQVDAQVDRIPRFIDKAARAGCRWVFVGIESVNPENLAAANKRQNHVEDYRRMLQAWHDVRVLTQAGYILGFPADTPQSIRKDIETLKRELPLDMVKFACLVPLPGSQDHLDNTLNGVWMDPDMNKYTGERVVTNHPRMSAEQWQQAYEQSWEQFYTFKHIEEMLRRGEAGGPNSNRLLTQFARERLSFVYERIQPLEGGYLRRKVRTRRRPGVPVESPLTFYPRRAWQMLSAYAGAAVCTYRMIRLRKKVKRESARAARQSHARLRAVPPTGRT
ncbi:MAG TPA: radical SAM protein [Phycisphaerae bacterium]|nr:radical SAM protein [Phycisphaerae bacterium]